MAEQKQNTNAKAQKGKYPNLDFDFDMIALGSGAILGFCGAHGINLPESAVRVMLYGPMLIQTIRGGHKGEEKGKRIAKEVLGVYDLVPKNDNNIYNLTEETQKWKANPQKCLADRLSMSEGVLGTSKGFLKGMGELIAGYFIGYAAGKIIQ